MCWVLRLVSDAVRLGCQQSFSRTVRHSGTKESWLDQIAWKSNAASFIAGMLVLAFGFGFMSQGTHEKLAKDSTEAALRPYLASSCAAQFRALPDYELARLLLLQKWGTLYGTCQAIPEKLVSLPGQSWADDKLAG